MKKLKITVETDGVLEQSLNIDIPDSASPPPPPPPLPLPDTEAPVITLIAPTFNASLSGFASIEAAASDNNEVLGVKFYCDGIQLGSEDPLPPYTFNLNTNLFTNGPHQLTASARDKMGNVTLSAEVLVMVANVVSPPIPPEVGGTAYEIKNDAEFNLAMLESGPGDTLTLRGAAPYNTKMEMRGDPGNRFGHTMGGAPGGWWTMQAYPGEKPVFAQSFAGYSIQYCRFLDIGFKRLGVTITDWISGTKRAHHVEIKRCTLAGDQQRFGFIQVQGDDLLIEDNTILCTGVGGLTTDHGIYLMNGARNTVRRNRIDKAAGYGIHAYDEKKHPGDAQTFYDDVLIEWNVISGCRMRAGIIASTGGDTQIRSMLIQHNIGWGNASGDISLNTNGSKPAVGLRVLRNTGEGKIYWNKPGITALIKDNIALGGVVGVNNSVNVTLDGNFTAGDPMFVDAANHDYRLKPGSPAEGRGAF